MIKSEKISIEQFNEIVSDFKNKGNTELVKAMDFLTEDFDETKQMIVELSVHLDNIETLYEKILKEYKFRTNG
jgi:hypothetical protein